MKSLKYKLMLLAGSALIATSLSQFAQAEMGISSSDIKAGKLMPKAQEFAGFGCTGDNLSPQLTWTNAPADTKSFAITAYDPDAPTGLPEDGSAALVGYYLNGHAIETATLEALYKR